jgi:hypothetical protein
VPVEHRPQRLHARLTGMLVELHAQRLRVDEVELVRLVHRPLEPHGLKFRRHVDQGLDGVGHGDPEAANEKPAGYGRATVDLDAPAGDHTAPPDGHVDPPVLLVSEAP